MIRGTPPNIFFRIFFDGKIFFVHSSFFSENGVRNELQMKESQLTYMKCHNIVKEDMEKGYEGMEIEGE